MFNKKPVENQYTDLAEYYDALMTSGYYDHAGYAKALHHILAGRKTVLDIGVGTGLLVEQLMKINEYDVTGVDFSPDMIRQAQKRLAHYPVELICDDIQNYTPGKVFLSAISMGGVFTFAYLPVEKQYRLYSYCLKKEACFALLRKIYHLLKDDGILCISIQHSRGNSELLIKDNITYTQSLEFSGNIAQKSYVFSREGKVLSEQTLKMLFFNDSEYLSLFESAGFVYSDMGESGKFFVFNKQTA